MKEFDSLKQCPGIENLSMDGRKPYGKAMKLSDSWTYDPSGLYDLPKLKHLSAGANEGDKLKIGSQPDSVIKETIQRSGIYHKFWIRL